MKCDESGATGESDAIKKVSYDECIARRDQNAVVHGIEGAVGGEDGGKGMESAGGHTDCFIVSGSKVLEGVGSYVVVAVGQKSFNGRIMMGLCKSLFRWALANKYPRSPARRCGEHAFAAQVECTC